MRKIIFLWGFVFLELVVITFLAGKIYLKQSQVLGEKISVNPISKDDVIFPNQDSDSDLKYFYEPMPNTDITYKPAWLPLDYAYTITINEDSLNERFDYSIEKDPHVFRIVTIGDSFTYGQYVDTKENYPERLENMLNENSSCKTSRKFEVINLGVGGYDIEYAVKRFKKRGLKYNPDLVLWLLRNDDIYEIKERIFAKSKEYKKQMEESGELKKYEEEGVFYAYNVKAAEDVAKMYGKEQILDYQYAAMKSLRRIYKNPLLILSFPYGLDRERKEFIEQFVKESSGAYFYDQLPTPIKTESTLPDGHPNKEGYALFANDALRYLSDAHLIPCI